MKGDPRRRVLPLALWPPRHRELWEGALAGRRGRFSKRGPAARLSERSLRTYREAYGRWLGFLDRNGRPGPDSMPGECVTPELAEAYFAEMLDLGNADHTVAGRFRGLNGALRLLEPGADFGWLLRPGGVPLRARLPMRMRSFTVHHSALLYRWGIELMEDAIGRACPRDRRVRLRDGLLIALFAARGMRLRSMHALRLGEQVRFDGEGWRVALEGRRDLKARRPIEYPVPRGLWPWIGRYVETERAELLGGRRTDAFWVKYGGGELSYRGLWERVRRRSAERFGEDGEFGPHRFRHAIGTTAPFVDPAAPGVASALLGVGAKVHREHYDRGERALAAGRFHQALERNRWEGEAFARRAWAGPGGSGRTRGGHGAVGPGNWM